MIEAERWEWIEYEGTRIGGTVHQCRALNAVERQHAHDALQIALVTAG